MTMDENNGHLMLGEMLLARIVSWTVVTRWVLR